MDSGGGSLLLGCAPPGGGSVTDDLDGTLRLKHCGDGVCRGHEDCETCPQDCGLCSAPDPSDAATGVDAGAADAGGDAGTDSGAGSLTVDGGARDGSVASRRPFDDSSPFNMAIPSNPRIDARSSDIVALMHRGRPLVSLYEYSPRIYEVDGNVTPGVAVTCTEPWGTCELETEPGGVPIPSGARGATGDDGHMVIWDVVNQVSYDFWRYRYPYGTASVGQTSWGGVVSTAGNGVDDPAGRLSAGGATGSDVARLAGIIRVHEVEAGVIPHALVGPTNNSCSTFRYPARKSDGWSTRSDCVPEGARVQLDPSIDLDTVAGLRPIDRMVAEAMQRYGWYNIDNGGGRTDGSVTTWVIQFEVDPSAHGFNCPSWGGSGDEPGGAYCGAGLNGDYDGLGGTLPDGSSLWAHLRVLGSWDGT